MTSKRQARSGGFTLLEALVALALLLAFAATIVPFLSQARGIMSYADRRVAAHVLLRSLLTAPYSRVGSPNMREGETSGLRWRVAAEPVYLDMMPPKEGAAWTPVRITATVAWGPGRSVTAETVRLGRLE
ncbi:MAG: prepilin-type N-terminal cleavage/methylation domain-containing protein [Microvirga sp.]|nr:prepilin-type N-terminal cleavage/methylation domain-containing protein [Bradyrhizobium sp.]HJW79751.1 prepilin-type N-terminal cleavage/methylation domain-containing protein [Beijerinckiaceae bacterium]